jgi:hypothetical protein
MWEAGQYWAVDIDGFDCFCFFLSFDGPRWAGNKEYSVE